MKDSSEFEIFDAFKMRPNIVVNLSKNHKKRMSLNFAQPEIAKEISNQLDTTSTTFAQLARNQSQLADQMRRFAQRLPDELRSDFASLIIKQNKIDKDMRTVSAQLRDINQNFEKHMPKRPPPQKLPKESFQPFNEEAYRRTNQNLMTWANRQQEEKKNERLVDPIRTAQHGTPCYFIPN